MRFLTSIRFLVAHLPFVIEDSREKKWKLDKEK
jgi:hypothetical protein